VISARILSSISRIERPGEARRFLRLDRYWSAEVAEALLARIDELVSLKPQQALELAEIALELVQRIRNASPLLKAQAHCRLGVAQRFQGHLSAAEASFQAVEKFAGPKSSALLNRVARHRALLFADLGRFEEALKLARSVVEKERREGDLASTSLVCEAVILGMNDQFEAAAECCSEVLRKEDPASSVYTSAMYNLAGVLARRPLLTYEVVDARKLLNSVRERIRGIRFTPVRYAVWYSEALLHAMLEEFRPAIDHLRSARSGFLRLRLLHSYARASVDLAIVHFRMQDEARVMQLISRTIRELAEAEAEEKLIDPFRQAEKEPTVQTAIEKLRPGASLPPAVQHRMARDKRQDPLLQSAFASTIL
jgi:tetratricopeptide (TPR) repeat protein